MSSWGYLHLQDTQYCFYNGDAHVVGIVSLLWSDLANNLGVDDFSAAVRWDLVVGNGKEGVGAFDLFVFVETGANVLA